MNAGEKQQWLKAIAEWEQKEHVFMGETHKNLEAIQNPENWLPWSMYQKNLVGFQSILENGPVHPQTLSTKSFLIRGLKGDKPLGPGLPWLVVTNDRSIKKFLEQEGIIHNAWIWWNFSAFVKLMELAKSNGWRSYAVSGSYLYYYEYHEEEE